MQSLSIDARFSGPPGYAQGGYLVGTLGNHSAQPLRVRLLQPTPLQKPLQLHHLANGVLELRDGEQSLVRGEPDADPGRLALQPAIPTAPDHLQAIEASRKFIGFKHHAFPNCFVCGTARARGDGLRIFAGRLADSDRVAAPWSPDASFGDSDGKVRPELIAAALDCPGYFAARSDGVPMLLGEFSVHIDRRIHIDESCVLVGWRIAVEGRKYRVGTVLFDEDGEPCARALGTWIEPRGGMPS